MLSDADRKSFLAKIKEYFKTPNIHIGKQDVFPGCGCVYVEFFVNGRRHLADVWKDGADINWIY